MPLTAADVAAFMGITSSDAGLVTTVDQATAATNALIAGRCVPDLPDPWPEEVFYAALMQAARLVKRRASPEGVAGMGDFGPVRISVMDPDIEAELGPWLWLSFA
jgi:hypothetical protein